MRVGKFPAFRQVAFDAAVGALPNAVVVDRRSIVQSSTDHFSSQRCESGSGARRNKVEINDFAVEADSEFAAVLRFAELSHQFPEDVVLFASFFLRVMLQLICHHLLSSVLQ